MEYWKKAAIIGGVGVCSDSMDFAAWLLILGVVAKEWGWAPALVGLSQSLARLIALPLHSAFSGLLTDYFGRKKIFCIGNFLTGLGFIWLSTATNFETVVAACALRIWSMFMTGIAGVFVVEEIPTEKRGFYYGLTRVFGVLGGLFATLGLSIFTIIGYGWRGVLLFDAGLNFLATILGLAFLRESTVWLERRNLIKQGKLPKEEKLPLRKAISEPKIRKAFLAASWIFLFLNFTRTGDWFGSTYQSTILKFDPATMGLIGMAGTLVGVVPGPVLGRLADKIGRIKVIALSLLLTILTYLLWFNTEKLVGVGTILPVLAYFTTTFVIWRIFFGGLGNFINLWQSEVYPTSLRATLSSWNYFFYAIPDILLPTVVGVVAGIVGLGTACNIFNIIGLLLVIPLWLGRETFETKGVKITATD